MLLIRSRKARHVGAATGPARLSIGRHKSTGVVGDRHRHSKQSRRPKRRAFPPTASALLNPNLPFFYRGTNRSTSPSILSLPSLPVFPPLHNRPGSSSSEPKRYTRSLASSNTTQPLPPRSTRRAGGTLCAALYQVPCPISIPPSLFTRPIQSTNSARPDSDITVRRKAAFLLNTLLTPSVAVAAGATATSSGARVHGGGDDPPVGAPVHPNSHASMVADPASVDTAPETLRALRTHKLLPVLVRELTEPTPYGPDGDEGDGCDADLEEKLTRFGRPYTMPLFFFSK
jgi:hypothetical protein